MIILDATTKSLEAKLSGAPATNQLPIVACYVDHTTTTYTPGASQTVTNSSTVVTALASPGASTQRQLKFLSIRQKDTAAVVLTVQYNDNATIRELWKGTLDVDDTLFYEEGGGFYVVDDTGATKGAGTGGGGSYNDENAQDAIGTILTDTATIDLDYNDSTPAITANVIPGGIKLDDLGAPDDNTDRDVSTSAHGLVPKITGSDGALLTKSGSASVWSSPAAAGDSTLKSVYGSAGSTANDGNLQFYTDGVYLRRDNGSTFDPWGPLYPLTEPPTSSWSWVNQGSATLTTTNGGQYIEAEALSTSPNMRLRTRTAPSAPYTITAVLMPNTRDVDYHHYGILFRQSSDGKIHALSIQRNTTPTLGSLKYTNATTFSATYTTITNFQNETNKANNGLMYLQIIDDNTNRVCKWSFDGVHFRQLHTIGRTDFLTADQVGFFVSSENASHAAGAWLISWAAT